jgi:hypothetical protein
MFCMSLLSTSLQPADGLEEAPRKHQRNFRVFQQASRNISACKNFSSKQQVLLCQLIGFCEKTQPRTEENHMISDHSSAF